MKAKLLKEQMGVLAGTEMEVLETGRAWTLRAPSGANIVVPACDVEMVPDTEPFSEPLLLVTDEYQEFLDEQRNSEVELEKPWPVLNFGFIPAEAKNSEIPIEPLSEPAFDPEDPGLLVNILGDQPQVEAERTLLDDERDVDAFPQAEPVEDDHDPKWEDSRDEASDPHPDDEKAFPEAHFSTAPSDLDESKPAKKKATKKKAADD